MEIQISLTNSNEITFFNNIFVTLMKKFKTNNLVLCLLKDKYYIIDENEKVFFNITNYVSSFNECLKLESNSNNAENIFNDKEQIEQIEQIENVVQTKSNSPIYEETIKDGNVDHSTNCNYSYFIYIHFIPLKWLNEVITNFKKNKTNIYIKIGSETSISTNDTNNSEVKNMINVRHKWSCKNIVGFEKTSKIFTNEQSKPEFEMNSEIFKIIFGPYNKEETEMITKRNSLSNTNPHLNMNIENSNDLILNSNLSIQLDNSYNGELIHMINIKNQYENIKNLLSKFKNISKIETYCINSNDILIKANINLLDENSDVIVTLID